MAQFLELKILFNTTYFDLLIAEGEEGMVGVKLPPPYFFLDRELLLIDLKLDTHT